MAAISEFYKRLRNLCEERNMTVNELVKTLELSSGSPTAWKNGTVPRNATLSKLSNFFGVTEDYLMGHVSEPYFYLDNERILREINSYGDEDEKKPTAESGERSRSRLRSVARLEDSQITPEQDQQIADYIDFLLSKKKDS